MDALAVAHDPCPRPGSSVRSPSRRCLHFQNAKYKTNARVNGVRDARMSIVSRLFPRDEKQGAGAKPSPAKDWIDLSDYQATEKAGDGTGGAPPPARLEMRKAAGRG